MGQMVHKNPAFLPVVPNRLLRFQTDGLGADLLGGTGDEDEVLLFQQHSLQRHLGHCQVHPEAGKEQAEGYQASKHKL